MCMTSESSAFGDVTKLRICDLVCAAITVMLDVGPGIGNCRVVSFPLVLLLDTFGEPGGPTQERSPDKYAG